MAETKRKRDDASEEEQEVKRINLNELVSEYEELNVSFNIPISFSVPIPKRTLSPEDTNTLTKLLSGDLKEFGDCLSQRLAKEIQPKIEHQLKTKLQALLHCRALFGSALDIPSYFHQSNFEPIGIELQFKVGLDFTDADEDGDYIDQDGGDKGDEGDEGDDDIDEDGDAKEMESTSTAASGKDYFSILPLPVIYNIIKYNSQSRSEDRLVCKKWRNSCYLCTSELLVNRAFDEYSYIPKETLTNVLFELLKYKNIRSLTVDNVPLKFDLLIPNYPFLNQLELYGKMEFHSEAKQVKILYTDFCEYVNLECLPNLETFYADNPSQWDQYFDPLSFPNSIKKVGSKEDDLSFFAYLSTINLTHLRICVKKNQNLLEEVSLACPNLQYLKISHVSFASPDYVDRCFSRTLR
eukprot:TRINITY_DN2425_c0_g2_i1.p1 TRINITY_DN2425_c0_g2~~TRINITY_DN2425_c0_g2_i1.p1  ORF type:complete len:409 (-),score=93.68 TRINITY_DN2425_c0_g2_i1:4-1230(-)